MPFRPEAQHERIFDQALPRLQTAEKNVEFERADDLRHAHIGLFRGRLCRQSCRGSRHLSTPLQPHIAAPQ
jgi:hypothetical protein